MFISRRFCGRRTIPKFSEKDIRRHRDKEKLKKDKEKEEKKKKNLYWLICLLSAFFMIVGTLLPVVGIEFEDYTYSLISVWVFGVSLTSTYSDFVVFFNPSTLTLGLILFLSGLIKLKISYSGRKEKQGKWFLWILILSIIEVVMLFLSVSLISNQKSFFSEKVGYTLSFDGVRIIMSLGFYSMLVGAILGFVAVCWDIIFRYVVMKEGNEK